MEKNSYNSIFNIFAPRIKYMNNFPLRFRKLELSQFFVFIWTLADVIKRFNNVCDSHFSFPLFS